MANSFATLLFFLLSVASLVLSEGGSLRSACNVTSSCSNTTSSISRRLQDDASLLNQLIAALLPTINSAIKQFAPDPLKLDLVGTINAGSLDIGGCVLSTDLTYNWGGITGLSEIFIETLEVIAGTESVTPGCGTSLWAGTFNIAVASLSRLELNDLGANWLANACGLSVNPSVGGDIITNNPFLGGTVEMSGDICGAVLNVNFAKIIDTLTIDYSSVEATLDNIPPFIGDIITTATRELSILLQGELISQVEPAIRPVIEEQIANAQTFAPAKVIPINLGFLRNSFAQRIRGAVNQTALFLGFDGSLEP